MAQLVVRKVQEDVKSKRRRRARRNRRSHFEGLGLRLIAPWSRP
jgi:plasmid stability protein